MFKLTIKSHLPIASRLEAELALAKRQAAIDSAQEAKGLVTKRIREGRRPDGAAHQPISAETARRKGHARPLDDTGLLGDESAWGVLAAATSVRLTAPPSRVRIIRYLDERGWPIISNPDPELLAVARRVFERSARQMRLGSTVRTKVIR